MTNLNPVARLIDDRAKLQEKPLAVTPLLLSAPKPIKPVAPIYSDADVNAAVELRDMLSYRRPHRSKNVKRFAEKYLTPLGCKADKFGNYILDVQMPRGGKSKVLWSCHTDTVHREGGMQKVVLRGEDFVVSSTDKSNCLGADCTTGVWIMVNMIRADVPGRYVFHAAEESGCLGSQYIRDHAPEVLDGIEYAIAFDRMNTKSIITHQMSSRCCSDEFAFSMNTALGGGYFLDDGGSYTDTATYVDVVPECTNISVGYFGQHGSKERQHVPTALALRNKMIAFDESLLVSKRDPSIADDDFHWGKNWQSDIADSGRTWRRSKSETSYDRLLKLVRNSPAGVADYLEQYGVDPDALEEHILATFGMIGGSSWNRF